VLRVLFRRELRLAEGPDRLWLPTQEGLIAELRGEVRPGGSVTVLVRWLGARQDGSETNWLFTVNEFSTQASQAAGNRVFSECQPSCRVCRHCRR
jgi:hypothetical protein